MCLFSVFGVVCCVLFYNPCACTLFVFGSGWSTVARLKLEGIDGKAPSGAELAACERVGGGGGGTGVCIDRVSVCTFETSACVPAPSAPSPHFSYMWAWCRYTRGRFERTHGCFHMFFTVPHHTTPHTPNTHHDHNDTTTTTTQHGDRNRERKRRRDKTRRQDKRREKMKEKREFDSTEENSPSPDTVRIDKLKALS